MADELRTIADAQHGETPDKLTQVYLERLRVVNRERRTAQDHTNHRGIVLRELVVGQDFTEGVQLTDTTADELRGLRTKIQDYNLLLHN